MRFAFGLKPERSHVINVMQLLLDAKVYITFALHETRKMELSFIPHKSTPPWWRKELELTYNRLNHHSMANAANFKIKSQRIDFGRNVSRSEDRTFFICFFFVVMMFFGFVLLFLFLAFHWIEALLVSGIKRSPVGHRNIYMCQQYKFIFWTNLRKCINTK